MRREKMAVFLHTVTIGDHRHTSHGLGHTSDEQPYKKSRVLARLELEKEQDKDHCDEVEPIQITAFDFDFLRYVCNSL